jgi:hypothetical protein
MGLLNSASLVVTPNGYKASKLYSVIPADGSGDMTFSRAGDTATRVNSSGLIETVLANKPRLDYTSSTCPKLLLEPQRTNLMLYSTTIGGAGTGNNNMTATSYAGTLPNGNTNGYVVTGNSGTLTKYISNAIATTTIGTYTVSYYVKYISEQYIVLRVTPDGVNGARQRFDILNGTISGAISSDGTSIGSNPIIQSFGNGWYRISLTVTLIGAITQILCQCWLSNYAAVTNTTSFVAYGGQLEAGAYPTSYIPTTTATVTRNVDVASKTGISSLLNSQEGTFVAFISPLKGNTGDLGGLKIDDSTNANNYVTIQFRDSPINVIAGSYRLNGAAISYAQASNTNVNGMTKVVYTYKNGSQKLFINGALVGSPTATISNSVVFDRVTSSGAATGVGTFYGNVHALSVFKTAISDSDAITLTTL